MPERIKVLVFMNQYKNGVHNY